MSSSLKNKIAEFNFKTRVVIDVLRFKNKNAVSLSRVLIFFAAIFFVFNYIGIFKHLNERPAYIHISAQTQRASIALNYYKTDMNFFLPKIQRYEKGEGITGVEFPIIYYMGAVMYKMFGFNEIYLKLISLFIVVFGLFYFYKLADLFVKNKIISIMITLAVALSPVFLIYTPNFLPDAPSLGLHLIAWYFFFEFLRTDNKRELNLFILFATLATLIKAIALLIFVIIICLVVLDKLKFFRKEEKEYIFKNHWRIIKAVIIGVLLSSTWYFYASWLSKHYDNVSFALKPIMIDSWVAFDKVMEFVTNLWLQYYYSYEGYVLLIVAAILVIVFMKLANRVLLAITILNAIGVCFYIYFFLNQFRDHDYYIIAILPTFFFLLLTMAEMVCRFADRHLLVLRVVLIIILFFNLKESIVYCKKMYTQRNSNDIHYWSGDYRAYEDLEPKLRNAGIKRTDKFISAFDETYCASLYLMDQIGVTVMSWTSKEEIDAFMKNPAMKYLVLNDSAHFNKIYPNKLENNIILYHRGLIVYKLK